jgi:glycosyltransferase involved in cell wall biosynthesis
LANDVPEHREVLEDAGVYFRAKDAEAFAEVLQNVVDNPEMVADYRKRTHQRILDCYTWDRITEAYEKLFYRIARKKVRQKENAEVANA